MNNKIIKAVSLLSSVFILTSCGGTVEKYNDPNNHYVSGTLHDFNINYDSGKQFIVDGESDYYIATISNEFAIKCAKYIAKHISLATGYDIPVIELAEDQIITSNEKAIIIGSKASYAAAGLKMTDKDIGITGYQLVTKDNAAFIMVNGNDGYELGGLKFLELTVGYDLMYGDFIVYEKDGTVLPYMDIVERPDFDFRKIDDNDTTWRYGAGFTDNHIFMTVNGGWQYHNSFEYIPPSEYLETHPNWYNTKYGGDKDHGQLCYTAHSHPEEVSEMVKIAANKMIQEIEAQPNLNNITFTIQDNYNMCECYGDETKYSKDNPDPNSCLGKKKHYNGAASGVTVEFVNAIDDIVQKHFEGSGREIYISIFAYHATELAPTIEKEDGTFVAVDGLHTNPHVCVFTAFISSNFTNSFYNTDKNLDANKKAKSWNAVSDTLYAWIYETNFGEYLYPFNTFTSMYETYRFLKENHISMVYNQGQHGASCRTAFNRLKLYLSSKQMINVNLDTKKLIDKFFNSYYGDGAKYMKQFYDEMVSWCLYQEQRWPLVFKGGVSSGDHYLANEEYWNEAQLNKWEQLVYEAIEAIEPLKTTNAFLYQQRSNAMMVESIFPRWALCNLFTASYSDAALKAKRSAFIEDANRLNFDEWAEGKKLQDWYSGNWGM